VVRELRDGPGPSACTAGDVLQLAATLSSDSEARCLSLRVESAAGRPLSSLPGAGRSECLRIADGELINEPVPGGLRLEPEWAGQTLTIHAFLSPLPPARGARPDAVHHATRRVVVRELPR